MTPRPRPVLAALLCLLLPLLLAVGRAYAAPAPRVLVAHSYHKEFVWTRLVNQGVSEALRGLGATIRHEYMDAKRSPDPAQLRSAAGRILALIESYRPQVVIAVDDAAQQYLVVPHLKGRQGLQVVFCGVNAPPSDYGYPAPNVSGVRERWHYRDGLKLLKGLAPSATSAAFLIEDTETGRSAVADLQEEERQGGPYALRLKTVALTRTFQQWQQQVRQAQGAVNALVLPLYHSLVDEATGQVVPADKVMAWTNSANRLPTLGLLDYARDHGLLCGVLESGQEQGWLAGSMAREVLTRRVAAGSLPIRVNRRGQVLLNLKTAQRLRIQIPYHLIESAGVVLR